MNIEKNIIDIQKLFIEGLENEQKKCINKKEILKLIYITRYYNLLDFNSDKTIYEVDEIKPNLNSYISKLIVKAIELKEINSITNDIELDISIIKDLLKSTILDLKNVEFIIEKGQKNYNIKIYDDESLEYTKNIGMLKKEGIKIDKRIKLFN